MSSQQNGACVSLAAALALLLYHSKFFVVYLSILRSGLGTPGSLAGGGSGSRGTHTLTTTMIKSSHGMTYLLLLNLYTVVGFHSDDRSADIAVNLELTGVMITPGRRATVLMIKVHYIQRDFLVL